MLLWQKLDHQGQLFVMHRDPEMWVPPHSWASLVSLWLWCQFAQVPTLHKELFAIISWSCWTELLPRGARRYQPLQQPPQPSALILEFSASSKFWSTGGFPPFFPLLSECLTGGDGLRQAQATLHGKFFLCMAAVLNVLQELRKTSVPYSQRASAFPKGFGSSTRSSAADIHLFHSLLNMQNLWQPFV